MRSGGGGGGWFVAQLRSGGGGGGYVAQLRSQGGRICGPIGTEGMCTQSLVVMDLLLFWFHFTSITAQLYQCQTHAIHLQIILL